MRKSRFTEAQIIRMFKDEEVGLAASALCPKHGLSPATVCIVMSWAVFLFGKLKSADQRSTSVALIRSWSAFFN
jgi:hypothetical protein